MVVPQLEVKSRRWKKSGRARWERLGISTLNATTTGIIVSGHSVQPSTPCIIGSWNWFSPGLAASGGQGQGNGGWFSLSDRAYTPPATTFLIVPRCRRQRNGGREGRRKGVAFLAPGMGAGAGIAAGDGAGHPNWKTGVIGYAVATPRIGYKNHKRKKP